MTATAQLNLTIDVDSDPISGSVANGTAEPQVFVGWIELVAAIEAARCTDYEGAATLGPSPAHAAVKTLGSVPGANNGKL
jgi:hypothetical protein